MDRCKGEPTPSLRKELLDMAAEDQRVRAELAAGLWLFDRYHPRMAGVHRRNAARSRPGGQDGAVGGGGRG